MFVLYPDPYLLPSYRISPFRTADISFNHSLADDDFIDNYFTARFPGKKYRYTYNGREAINLALRYYKLNYEDVVTILTTTGNTYISSCVTNEIEKFCKWSHKIESNTRVILVNHEFGYPYEDMVKLKEHKLPIIEDCAHSFFSSDVNNKISRIGDFVIYSFPKIFPIQIGGLIVMNIENDMPESEKLSHEKRKYIKKVVSYNLRRKDDIIHKRQYNYLYLKELFKRIGLNERFKSSDNIVPGVFMFNAEDERINLNQLKKHYYIHGIQCSVFYGENSFYIPTHQALNEHDMQFFRDVMAIFLENPDM